MADCARGDDGTVVVWREGEQCNIIATDLPTLQIWADDEIFRITNARNSLEARNPKPLHDEVCCDVGRVQQLHV